jgi:hypothetical protein
MTIKLLTIMPAFGFVYVGLAAFFGLPMPFDLTFQAWIVFTLFPTWFVFGLCGMALIEIIEECQR